MDYDVISNTTNLTVESEVTPEESMSQLLHEIVFALCCVLGTVSNCMIVFVVCYFKKCRSVPEIYVCSWAVADIGFLISTPCFYRIISVMHYTPIHYFFFCVLTNVQWIGLSLNVIFVTLLSLDWYIKSYHPVVSRKFRNYSKGILTFIWIFNLICLSYSTGMCVTQTGIMIPHLIAFYGFGITCFTVVLIHCMNWIKIRIQNKVLESPKYILYLATSFVICWLPSWASVWIAFYGHMIFIYISILAACLGYLNSVITLIILYTNNNQFKKCFLHCYHRCIFKNYEEHDINTESVEDFVESNCTHGSDLLKGEFGDKV